MRMRQASEEGDRILADCYTRKGQYQDAIRTYALILQRSPGNVPSLVGLAVAYRMTGDLKRSEDILVELSRRSHPLIGNVYLELARTLELKEDWEGAVRNYQSASRSAGQKRESYIGLARLHKKLGDKEKALDYLMQLRSLYPGDRAIETELRALNQGG